MEEPLKIYKILFSIHQNIFNGDKILLSVNQKIFTESFYLDKINSINDNNVYSGLCDILWDEFTISFKIINKESFNTSHFNLDSHLNRDDVNYNHVNDIFNKRIYKCDEYDYEYSICNKIYNFTNYTLAGTKAITFYAKPLKYSTFVLLIISEFLNENEYNDDIKIPIMLSYNDI